MAIKFSEEDTRMVREFLDTILSEHKLGNLTLPEARLAIEEAIAWIARDVGNIAVFMIQAIVEYRGKDDADRS